ncbi:MAG TPA: K(+)-transporting ATPase subunit F [Verrucomicrobiae bacterium]|nr:K(+)-transporting ATPase subunit F [Verrucomicrobiae bacterium]
MNAADIVLLVIATLMFVYLGVALFNPERF